MILPRHILIFLLFVSFSGYSQKKPRDVSGLYMNPCVSQNCSKCLSIKLLPDSSFMWQEWSPCEAKYVIGKYKASSSGKADTLCLYNCEKFVLKGRTNDTLERRSRDTQLENEKFVVRKKKLFFRRQKSAAPYGEVLPKSKYKQK